MAATTGAGRRRTWTVRTGADLGRAVAGVRDELGLTQQQLADATGLDRTYLARLEAGASVQLLDRALRALRRMGAEVTISVETGADDQAEPDGEAVG
ncbi:MAG TPA: helix-turn-helix transcriptional regulator [Acidimicrobiales bacterium]